MEGIKAPDLFFLRLSIFVSPRPRNLRLDSPSSLTPSALSNSSKLMQTKRQQTGASISKIRAERAALADQIAALSAALLPQAQARLAAARARFEGASAAQRCLEHEIEAKRFQTDELRAAAAELSGRRAMAGKGLREVAEGHVEKMASELAKEVKEATERAGGAFLAHE